MRLLPVLLLAVLALAACGDRGPEPPRLQLERFSFDPPLPDGLRAVVLGGTEDGRAFPIVATDTGYAVPGAPDGYFRVEGPRDWWMVSLASQAPELRSGAPPTRVTLGRSRSVYIGAMAPTVRPSRVWGASRLLEGGRCEPVPVEVLADDGGYVVCVRFAPDAWRGELELVGRVALGPPEAQAPVDEDSPLANPIRFTASEDGRPLSVSMRQAASAPLDVVLVAASPAVETDGRRVRVTLEGVPLDVTQETTCHGGVAHFRSVPALDKELSIRLDDDPSAQSLDPSRRRANANTRVLVVGDLPTREVRVPVGAGTTVDGVQVRPHQAVAFGRVPFEQDGGRVAFRAPRGPFRALLRAGRRWAEVAGQGDADVDLPEARFEPEAILSGSVSGVSGRVVVRLFRQHDDEAVLGDGLELAVDATGAFQCGVPAGTYLVEVAGPEGERRRPAPVVAASGSRIHLPLEAP